MMKRAPRVWEKCHSQSPQGWGKGHQALNDKTFPGKTEHTCLHTQTGDPLLTKVQIPPKSNWVNQ